MLKEIAEHYLEAIEDLRSLFKEYKLSEDYYHASHLCWILYHLTLDEEWKQDGIEYWGKAKGDCNEQD